MLANKTEQKVEEPLSLVICDPEISKSDQFRFQLFLKNGIHQSSLFLTKQFNDGNKRVESEEEQEKPKYEKDFFPPKLENSS